MLIQSPDKGGQAQTTMRGASRVPGATPGWNTLGNTLGTTQETGSPRGSSTDGFLSPRGLAVHVANVYTH